MKLLEHKNNTSRWHAKAGDAGWMQVADFAHDYRKDHCSVWAVCVTEGLDWIARDDVSSVGDAIRAKGAVAVWVSNGLQAQCVWRVPTAEEVSFG